jgi:hypothetical protein
LIQYLYGREWFQAEDVAEKLNIDIKYVQQAIHKLRIMPGWSIKEKNKSRFTFSEVFWRRTVYNILKRPSDTIS